MIARCPRPAVLAQIPLDRHAVIEASAGTGKTCTNEHLVVDRLLRACTVDHLLVVDDNCERVASAGQRVLDGDGAGDVCDPDDDGDGDRISDAVDLCPWARDHEQRDGDGDGLGDACDPDRDNDGVLDVYQLCEFGGCDPVGPIRLFGEPVWP